MVRRFELTDVQWVRLQKLIPAQEGSAGRHGTDDRMFINAVLWIARTGSPWRDLPERFGKWNTVFTRFNRWSKSGVWEAIFEELKDPDLKMLMVDSTIVRAHQHAAGAKKKSSESKR